VTSNPARLLGRPAPALAAGQPASFVIFQRPDPEQFVLDRTCVDGAFAVA